MSCNFQILEIHLDVAMQSAGHMLYRNILHWRVIGVSILLGYFAQKPMMRTLNLPVRAYSMLPMGISGAKEESGKWNTSAWVTLMGPLLPGLLTCFFMQQSQGKTVACEEMSRESVLDPPELKELSGKAGDPITIVVCGLTGTGKSSLCRLLSQCSDCKEGNGFESVTADVYSCDFRYNGRSYRIIDTPGFHDTAMTEEELVNRISKFASHARSGIHAVLICTAQGRLTKENEAVIQEIACVLGEEALGKYGFLVVTKTYESGDSIKDSLLGLPKDNVGHRMVELVGGERIISVETKAWWRARWWQALWRPLWPPAFWWPGQRASILDKITSHVERNNYAAVDCRWLQFERIREEKERQQERQHQKRLEPLNEKIHTLESKLSKLENMANMAERNEELENRLKEVQEEKACAEEKHQQELKKMRALDDWLRAIEHQYRHRGADFVCTIL